MKRLLFKTLTISLFAVLLLPACQKNNYEMNGIYTQDGSGTENATEVIEKVADLKIYFGHRSVGNNILGGVEQWEKETGVQLKKVESKDFSTVGDASLVHFRVGSNSDPRSKIDDFVTLVEQIPQEGAPVAFFKLCYVDITRETDIDPLFAYYKEKMLYLKDNYPNIRFMVSTVPLMGLQKGLKATVKKILGRQATGVLGNIKRNEFNEQLIKEFKGVLPVFDLGGIESTRPDGTIETYSFKGNEYACMYKDYTYDYGHLTEFGSKTLSYNLLAFLAKEFK
jgi:hypothetical protein